MKEFMKITAGMFLALGIVVSGIAVAGTGQTKGSVEKLPTMGKSCVLGKTVFYGQMSRTRSEEKLCKVSDNEYYFFTRNGTSAQVASTKITSVTKVEIHGSVGKTLGYDFSLLTGDSIKFRAVYRADDQKPFAGYFIINDYAIDLEPATIVFN